MVDVHQVFLPDISAFALLWLNGEIYTATFQNLLEGLPRRIVYYHIATQPHIYKINPAVMFYRMLFGVTKLNIQAGKTRRH